MSGLLSKNFVAKAKIIVFDFDGVFVLDSDAVFKKEAWSRVLQPWVGQYQVFLEEGNRLYGSGKPGGRREILRYILRNLGQSSQMISVLEEKIVQEFDKYVNEKILDAGLAEGAREMLQILFNRNIKLYLNSGTETSALGRVVQGLKINHFFSGVLGSTKDPYGGSKIENLEYIAARERVKPEAVLFIGDQDSDYQAALGFKCQFVGFANRWNGWERKSVPFPVVAKLSAVPKLII